MGVFLPAEGGQMPLHVWQAEATVLCWAASKLPPAALPAVLPAGACGMPAALPAA